MGWRTYALTTSLALTLAAVLACGPGDGARAVATDSTAAAQALKPFNVVVLGDSIAAGTGATSDSMRWWIRAQTLLREALPQRAIVFKSSALPGSGLEHLERTAAAVSPLAYQAAVVIEGRNDFMDDGSWLPRYAGVIEGLEAKGIIVLVGTYPPDLIAGAFIPVRRNGAIRTLAEPKRRVLDFEQRWLQAGPTVAGPWYSDAVHASDAGQAIQAEIALAVFLVVAR